VGYKNIRPFKTAGTDGTVSELLQHGVKQLEMVLAYAYVSGTNN
jgi:hypothetical protein